MREPRYVWKKHLENLGMLLEDPASLRVLLDSMTDPSNFTLPDKEEDLEVHLASYAPYGSSLDYSGCTKRFYSIVPPPKDADLEKLAVERVYHPLSVEDGIVYEIAMKLNEMLKNRYLQVKNRSNK